MQTVLLLETLGKRADAGTNLAMPTQLVPSRHFRTAHSAEFNSQNFRTAHALAAKCGRSRDIAGAVLVSSARYPAESVTGTTKATERGLEAMPIVPWADTLIVFFQNPNGGSFAWSACKTTRNNVAKQYIEVWIHDTCKAITRVFGTPLRRRL